MQNTINYNLKKPDYTDFADIQDINDNMDKIDEELAAPTGDTADSTATFTCSDVSDGDAAAWTNVPALTSGETHKSLFAKMSQMFKNSRFLYKLLGTTDISNIGDGTVTKALSVLNANFGKIINSDAELDALSGTCFFGGSYESTYFGALDYNGVQIDNAQQRTQIVVVTSDLLYRVDDIGTGHEGNWSEWNAIPYNTATLLNSLNNDVANISSLLSSNGETFKFIVLSGVGFDAAYAQTQSNSVSILHILDTQLTAPFASNNFVAIQWKNGTGNFGFQFVLGYDATNSNKIAIRTRGNGVWGNWRTI